MLRQPDPGFPSLQLVSRKDLTDMLLPMAFCRSMLGSPCCATGCESHHATPCQTLLSFAVTSSVNHALRMLALLRVLMAWRGLSFLSHHPLLVKVWFAHHKMAALARVPAACTQAEHWYEAQINTDGCKALVEVQLYQAFISRQCRVVVLKNTGFVGLWEV